MDELQQQAAEKRLRRACRNLGLTFTRPRGGGPMRVCDAAGQVQTTATTLEGIEAWLTAEGSGRRKTLVEVPDHRLGRWEVLIGEACDGMRTLPSASVQTIVTSPPYFGHRNYGSGSSEIGQETTVAEYVGRLVKVFAEAHRVLRDDGTLWLNLGDGYAANASTSRIPRHQQGNGSGVFEIPVGQQTLMARRAAPNRGSAVGLPLKSLMGIPWRVAFALQDAGWLLRSAIVWQKPAVMPESVTDRPTSTYEMVFLFAKSKRYFYDAAAIAEPSLTPWNSAKGFSGGGQQVRQGQARGKTYGRDLDQQGRNSRNLCTIPTSTFKGAHFATMPVGLASRCILAGSRPGDTVLDPFGGAGTTGLAAIQHGRDAILVELQPEYEAMIHTRLRSAKLAPPPAEPIRMPAQRAWARKRAP